ncbi:MAG: hypothetical protein ACFFCZ_11400 [Promethearchaeota archaeon]
MTLFGLFVTPEKWEDILRSALQAEKLGVDSVWIDDHLLNAIFILCPTGVTRGNALKPLRCCI